MSNPVNVDLLTEIGGLIYGLRSKNIECTGEIERLIIRYRDLMSNCWNDQNKFTQNKAEFIKIRDELFKLVN